MHNHLKSTRNAAALALLLAVPMVAHADIFYGDDPVSLDGKEKGKRQVMLIASGDQGYGDTFEMFDRSQGGNDRLVILPGTLLTRIYGDAEDLYDTSKGGNDTLISGDHNPAVSTTPVFLYGDATFLHNSSQGGNDALYAGNGTGDHRLYGDAAALLDESTGGNDTLNGGAGSGRNLMFGDAGSLENASKGGNDTLIAGSGSGVQVLIGDAIVLAGTSRGGNDILIGGPSYDRMMGDGLDLLDDAIGGADVFVLAPGGGVLDEIFDFRQGDSDQIDVSAHGVFSMAELVIADDGVDTTIEFADGSMVTLLEFPDSSVLVPEDFIFDD